MHLTHFFFFLSLHANKLNPLHPSPQHSASVLASYAFMGQKKKILIIVLLFQCFRFVQMYKPHELRIPKSFPVCKKEPVLMSVMNCIENLYV